MQKLYDISYSVIIERKHNLIDLFDISELNFAIQLKFSQEIDSGGLKMHLIINSLAISNPVLMY